MACSRLLALFLRSCIFSSAFSRQLLRGHEPLAIPLPSQCFSSVLLPSLALDTAALRSSQQFFRAPSDLQCKVNSPRGPVSCGDQSQLRREDRRAALRRQDPREKPKQVDIFWIVLLKPLHCIIIAPSFARVHLK